MIQGHMFVAWRNIEKNSVQDNFGRGTAGLGCSHLASPAKALTPPEQAGGCCTHVATRGAPAETGCTHARAAVTSCWPVRAGHGSMAWLWVGRVKLGGSLSDRMGTQVVGMSGEIAARASDAVDIEGIIVRRQAKLCRKALGRRDIQYHKAIACCIQYQTMHLIRTEQLMDYSI